MSNKIQYDPLIARYLAEELDARLRGRGCTAAPFFAPDLSVTLPFEGGVVLRADLHPGRGWVRVLPTTDEYEELDAICTGISAPADERRLIIDMDVVGRFRDVSRSIVLELHTNQWNAIVLDRSTSSIVNVLRGRRAGGRALFPGQAYTPPPPSDRAGHAEITLAEGRRLWDSRVEALPRAERRDAILRTLALTGTLNTRWILEAETDEAAFERWWWLRSAPVAEPGILAAAGGGHPYPLRLDGWEFEPEPSLLTAMARVAERTPSVDAEEGPTLDAGAAERMVRDRLAATARKIDRLQAQLTAASGEAERLRGWGDLLLARIADARRGMAEIELEGWDGATVRIPLDPEIGPAENAKRLYEEARRKERAQARIPALMQAAEEERREWLAALEEVSSGRVPERLAERLRHAAEKKVARSASSVAAPALPYRTFRTSGGIECRVGRSSRDNDRLTFQESSPNDVWLHARSVAGSHVILRWKDPAGAPPARDLEEAAQLAALFSRARSSGLVAVDWTRRKHVRKPRGAAPGLVIPQRVKTLMVEPDEELPDRLAVL